MIANILLQADAHYVNEDQMDTVDFDFDKDKIIIPISQNGHHWLRFLWQSRQTLFDSLPRRPDIPAIMQFLTKCPRSSRHTRLNHFCAKQANNVDCVLYLREFLELLFECLPLVEDVASIQRHFQDTAAAFDPIEARNRLSQDMQQVQNQQ
ncbi:hypothetical protein MIR68_000415 [Amoeboaphelidium protococcarum]|nr:hypothetical protein MIR68_000415 [Amoeboaphelidium protococcarum]